MNHTFATIMIYEQIWLMFDACKYRLLYVRVYYLKCRKFALALSVLINTLRIPFQRILWLRYNTSMYVLLYVRVCDDGIYTRDRVPNDKP